MLCEGGVNLSVEQQSGMAELDSIRSVLFPISIPITILGIAFNTLCLTYFLRHQRTSLADRLIIGLNLCDLLTCLFVPADVSVPLEEYIDKFLWEVISLRYCGCLLMYWSLSFTTILWATRMFSILRPLRRVRKKLIIIITASQLIFFAIYLLFATYVIGIPCYKASICGDLLSKKLGEIMDMLNIAGSCSYIALCPILIVITARAHKKLNQEVTTQGSLEEKRRAAVTVVILLAMQITFLAVVSILYLLTTVMLMTAEEHSKTSSDAYKFTKTHYRVQSVSYLNEFFGLATSAVNPLVYIFRNGNLNRWISDGCRAATRIGMGRDV